MLHAQFPRYAFLLIPINVVFLCPLASPSTALVHESCVRSNAPLQQSVHEDNTFGINVS
jgi:hypothetical protein